jgi:predicted regulator of Ras-like GTPase activity (Roadblock/LC7/MglB family)
VIPSVAASSGRGNAIAVATALATLKDVAGIAGSFVFTSSGHLVARELHAMFDDAALREAAERLTRLSDTFASVGDHLELAVIRFQDHKLYLKVLSGGMLCILADGVVNMAALRMAANLVGRRITPDLDEADAQGDALPPMTAGGHTLPAAPQMPETSAAPTGAVRAQVIAPGTGRRFRGRPLE